MSEANRNVYVASLPITVDDQQLYDLFAPYGSISSARIMRAKGSRQSKGYGFVLYKDSTSAERAIEALHGQTVAGSRVQVRLANADTSAAFIRSPSLSGCPPSPGSTSSSATVPQSIVPPTPVLSAASAGQVNLIPVSGATRAYPTQPLQLAFSTSLGSGVNAVPYVQPQQLTSFYALQTQPQVTFVPAVDGYASAQMALPYQSLQLNPSAAQGFASAQLLNTPVNVSGAAVQQQPQIFVMVMPDGSQHLVQSANQPVWSATMAA